MKTLKFRKKLKTSTLVIRNVDEFMVKEIEITIKETTAKTKNNKWQVAGSANLGGALDDKNIRDIAYD